MDAAAFFSTAIAVLAVNAVAAVVVGCSMYCSGPYFLDKKRVLP
jgi:hypothetical protein